MFLECWEGKAFCIDLLCFSLSCLQSIRSGSAIYQIGCDVDFTVEGGGSSDAGRVCANLELGPSVDIGDMSRSWKEEEAKQRLGLGYLYDCLQGDTERSALQVPVALDGVTVATGVKGAAAECMAILDGKLTIDQLRWIYSNYTESQLDAAGWDKASIKNPDRDPSTHLWSELDARCQPMEIEIAGPGDSHGTYAFFMEVILTDAGNGEGFASNRNVNYNGMDKVSALLLYLQQVDSSIAYFGYTFYYENKENLLAAKIQNDMGDFVAPSHDTIADSSYNPLSRAIFMNVRNDKDSLENTGPFVSFGLQTDALVRATGFVPITKEDTQIWLQRLQAAPYGQDESSASDLSAGAITGIVLSGALLISCFFMGCVLLRKGKNGVDVRSEQSNY